MRRFQKKDSLVMLARHLRLVQLIRVEVGQCQMGPGILGFSLEQQLELLGGILGISGLTESQGKAIAGSDRVGTNGERVLTCLQCLIPIAGIIRCQAQIEISVKVGGIRGNSLFVIGYSLRQNPSLLGARALGK